MIRRAAFIFVIVTLALTARQAAAEPISLALRAFLMARFPADRASDKDWPTRVTVAEMTRKNGKTDMVIYISGNQWCGTGGCNLMILEPEGATFRVLGDMGITRPPVVQLAISSHGHPDIAVAVSGGGIQPGYDARLRFDGKRYPQNPTVPPAKPIKGGAKGKVLISGAIFAQKAPDSARGDLLYQ